MSTNRGYYRQARGGTGKRLGRMLLIAVGLAVAVGYGMYLVLPAPHANLQVVYGLFESKWAEIGFFVLALTLLVGSL